VTNIPYSKLITRDPLTRGVIVRVFDIAKNGWLKISSKKEHWVSGRFSYKVWKAIIKSDEAVSRIGAGSEFDTSSVFHKNEELFVSEKKGNWYNVNTTMEWLHESDLLILGT
jgi:hypothetical protein